MHPPQIASIFLPLLVGQAFGASLHCDNIVVDGYKYDLSKLGGPHSVVTTQYESGANTYQNTTYTLDICQPLKKSGKGKKTEECPNGTMVCAIQRFISGETDMVRAVIAIAGYLQDHGGSVFDSKVERLKSSDSHSDSQKEGLRVVLEGGKHPLDGPVKERRKQTAIVEFICDQNKEGTEGEWDSEDKYEKDPKVRREENNEDDDGGESGVEHQLRKDDAALIWESYGPEKEANVLRLTWHTKYACDKRDGDNGGNDEQRSESWGFFTWLVIVVFLGIAAYLIFGSWLNYNRYGARGWDLLPHGDTIRDIPYLLKDWTRRVLNTVQGVGSRGGYSAV